MPQIESDLERVVLWPLWIAIGWPALLIATDAFFSPGFIYSTRVGPLLLLTWATFALRAAILAVQAAHRKHWRASAVAAVLPVTVLAVTPQFISLADLTAANTTNATQQTNEQSGGTEHNAEGHHRSQQHRIQKIELAGPA